MKTNTHIFIKSYDISDCFLSLDHRISLMIKCQIESGMIFAIFEPTAVI